MAESNKHVVIIGNGISGITAARHIRKKSDHRITVIGGETEHFFSRTALMYIYMGHMKYEHTKPYEDHFWEKNRIELVNAWVTKIDCENKRLLLDNGELNYDILVVATGSVTNKFGWPGQDLEGVQGLYSIQDLELLEKNTHPALCKPSDRKVKHAVIVGGGLIGVELAEMLVTRHIEVTFLVRESRFWGNVLPHEEGDLVCRHIREHHIDLKMNTELAEILPDDNGRVRAVRTSTGEEIDCQLVGLTAGVSPNIGVVKSSSIETNRGVMVNRFLETNVPDVYAIGDCAEIDDPHDGRGPVEQVWYTGKIMGETVAKTICGDRTEYEPGFWFNSAKFFDIEYQTYGTVLSEPVEGQDGFYWEHPKGKIGIKFVFENGLGKLVGVNSMGIRLRHELFDHWLKNKKDIKYVLTHLKDANFDPEFYGQFESQILDAFNNQYGTSLRPKKRSWKRILHKA